MTVYVLLFIDSVSTIKLHVCACAIYGRSNSMNY